MRTNMGAASTLGQSCYRSMGVALSVALLPFFVSAETISYKGLSLGATQAEYRERLPRHSCGVGYCVYTPTNCDVSSLRSPGGAAEWAEQSRVCTETNSFGGERPEMVAAKFRDDRLVKLDFVFTSQAVDRLVGTVSTRFGDPTKVETYESANAYGSSYPNRRTIWEFEEETVTMVRHGAGAGKGTVKIVSKSEIAASQTEAAQEVKKKASDF